MKPKIIHGDPFSKIGQPKLLHKNDGPKRVLADGDEFVEIGIGRVPPDGFEMRVDHGVWHGREKAKRRIFTFKTREALECAQEKHLVDYAKKGFQSPLSDIHKERE